MGSFKDLSGQRFGRLVAINHTKIPNKQGTFWLCKCDCGKETYVSRSSLIRGYTTSCGCYHREKVSTLAQERCKKYNEYSVVGNTVYVKMIHDNTMICDLDDWERLKHICWSANGQRYAVGVDLQTHKRIKFHMAIMGKKEGYFIDHINRNRLDNRKENLRFVTPQENTWNISLGKKNKSGTVGVYERNGRWVASIGINRKTYHIGIYDTKKEAVLARKEAEKIYQPLPERLIKEA